MKTFKKYYNNILNSKFFLQIWVGNDMENIKIDKLWLFYVIYWNVTCKKVIKRKFIILQKIMLLEREAKTGNECSK